MKWRLILLFFLLANYSFGQNIYQERIDEVNKAEGIDRYKKLISASNEFKGINPKQAMDFLEKAIELSEKNLSINSSEKKLNELKAEICFNYGEYDKALNIYRSLFIEEQMNKVFDNQIRLLIKISKCLIKTEEFDEAKKQLELASDLNEIIDDKKFEAEINLIYAGLSYDLYQSKARNNQMVIVKLEDAFKNNQTALKLFQEINDQVGVSDAINQTGKLFWLEKKFDLSLQNFLEALDIRIALDRNDLVALSFKNLGLTYSKQKKFDKSIDCIQKSTDLYKMYGNELEVANNFYALGNVYFHAKQNDNARKNYYEAYKMYRNKNYIQKAAKSAQVIAHTFRQFNIDSAIVYLNLSQALYEKVGMPEMAISLTSLKASYFNKKHDYYSCLKYRIEVVQMCKKFENNEELFRALLLLGHLYKQLAANLKAIEIYEVGFETAQSLNETTQAYLFLTYIANTYANIENIDKAIEYYNKAINIKGEQLEKKNIHIIYSNLGLLYLKKNEFRKSKRYLDKNLELKLKTNDPLKISLAYSDMSKYYYVINNKEKALELLDQALNYVKQVGSKRELSGIYAEKATIYYELNNLKEAEKYAFMTIELTENKTNKIGTAKAYKILSDLYEQKEEYKKAMEAMKNNIDIIQEVYDSKLRAIDVEKGGLSFFDLASLSEKEIKSISMNFENLKYEQEIENLKRQNVNKTKLLFVILIASGVIIALIILVYQLIGRRKKKTKSNSEVNYGQMNSFYSSNTETLDWEREKMNIVINSDVRLPLNYATSLISDSDKSTLSRVKYLELIEKQLSNVENWIKLISKNLVIENNNVNLNEIITESIDKQKDLFKQKEVKINFDISQTRYIKINEILSKGIMDYLVLSSLYFADDKTMMKIEVKSLPEHWKIKIVSKGEQIEPELLNNILYQKVNLSIFPIRFAGFRILKEIIEFNKGKLSIQSNETDNIITFQLPSS